MSKRSLEEIVEEYKTNPHLTPKIRAELEAEIGQYRTPDVLHKNEWIGNLVGENKNNVDRRSRIYSLGLAADPIWEQLAGAMPLATGVKLAQEAKATAHRLKIPLERAVLAGLEEYLSYEGFRFLAGGKVIRVPSAAQRRRMARGKPVTVIPTETQEEEEAPVSSIAPTIPLLTQDVDEASFWRNLKAMVSGYIDQRLTDFDGIEKATIKRDIEAELGVVIESLRSRTHLRQSRRKARISFSEVEQACSSLAMDPPARGQLPDLELAKKMKRLMAREYHPDSAGNDAKSGQLKVVIDAYNLLEGYVAQMKYSESQGANRSYPQTKGKTRGDSHD